MSKLNGWQRLWVLVSGLWLILIVTFIFFNPPLPGERVEATKDGFLVWAIPCAVLYVLGWAVGWVKRGFKGNPKEPRTQ